MRCAARRCTETASYLLERGECVLQLACEFHAAQAALFEDLVDVVAIETRRSRRADPAAPPRAPAPRRPPNRRRRPRRLARRPAGTRRQA
ncbi:hypothetical protein ACL02T_34040 [Pseudonocardia sp. RS010]|uniref:hypothetical protein n=1 Tax=Pseudonocardia sp. RS010 TaxID=3385979 RepID=UPI00399F2080